MDEDFIISEIDRATRMIIDPLPEPFRAEMLERLQRIHENRGVEVRTSLASNSPIAVSLWQQAKQEPTQKPATFGEMARDVLMMSAVCAAFAWLFWLLLK